MRVGGVVLCGGQSSRMGRPKAWLPFGDEVMLVRVVRLLSEVVAPLVVVAAPEQEVPTLPEGILLVRDPERGRGPLQGLAAGLQALRGQVEAAYVSSCDVPFLRPAFVRRLIELLGTHAICVPRADGYFHPLAAVYRIEVADLAARLLAEDRLRAGFLFEKASTRIVEAEELSAADPGLQSLRNLNTPEEYEQALRETFHPGQERPMSRPTPTREVDLFVPLHYNDGTPVEADKLAGLRRRLVDRFGGLTDLRQRSEGHWKVGGVTFRDEIVIYRLLAEEEALPFLAQLKAEMKQTFQQEDVLMIVRSVEVL